MATIKTTFKAIHKVGTVCDYCRYLVAEGFGKGYILEIYRDCDEPDLIINNISRMAELTVREEPYLSFQKFRPMDEKARLRTSLKRQEKLHGTPKDAFK